jgi:hypothetical protein
VVRSQPGQIVCETPSPKITRAKWNRGVAQAVECLLCKCKTEFKLQSHQKATGKKKKEKKEKLKMPRM